jgi:hypothetical protein
MPMADLGGIDARVRDLKGSAWTAPMAIAVQPSPPATPPPAGQVIFYVVTDSGTPTLAMMDSTGTVKRLAGSAWT